MEISIASLFALTFAHLIGDFFMQSNKMATEKSSNNIVLLRHVLIYILPFGVIVPFSLTFVGAVVFLVVNVALHYMTDWVSSRVAANYFKQDKRHEFFITIGIDQFVHIMTLATTFAAIKAWFV